MTTRKPRDHRRNLIHFVTALSALAVGGCSTPGPLHLYSTSARPAEVHDCQAGAPDITRDVPAFVEPLEEVTGFAYDPFTDHFFLRLAPGNHVRVVDRPARKIKREFTIDGAPAGGGGDLAVGPRDGHLFLIDPMAPELVEATRLGKFVGRIVLQQRTTPAAAVAFDSAEERILILDAGGRTVERYDRSGARIGAIQLSRPAKPALAFDADRRELYAPLADEPGTVGVFDENGACVRTLRIPPGDSFIDVGPHSFLRVF